MDLKSCSVDALLGCRREKIGNEVIESFYLGKDPVTVRQLIEAIGQLPAEVLDAVATRGDFYEETDIGFIKVVRVKDVIKRVEFD